jgi:hypothetical protein
VLAVYLYATVAVSEVPKAEPNVIVPALASTAVIADDV